MRQDYYNDLKKEFIGKFRKAGVECLPDGWRATLIEPLINELFDALGINSQFFIPLDIKEKYGELRLYWDWDEAVYQNMEDTETEMIELASLFDDVQGVIDKYAKKSERTCVKCGKTDNVRIDAYMELPLCKHCTKSYKKRRQKEI